MTAKSTNPVQNALKAVVPRKYSRYTPWIYRGVVLVLLWAFIGLLLGDYL